MAILVAVAGAAVGSVFGVPAIGWLAGSIIGNLLFPPNQPQQNGPQVGDLSVTASAYGAMIPICYGTMRMGGIMTWCQGNKIIAVPSTSSSGGKGSLLGGGSSSQTTYDYFASFQIKFAKGPAAAVLRMWGDGKLMYDVTSGAQFKMPGLVFRFYAGTEDQLPDPLIEAEHGVGQVSADRGDVTIVFDMLPLANFANHIPSVTAEIAFNVTHQPARVVQLQQSDPTVGGLGQHQMAIDWATSRMYIAHWVNTNPDTDGYVAEVDIDTMSIVREVSDADCGSGNGITDIESGYVGSALNYGYLAVKDNYLYRTVPINGGARNAAIAKIDRTSLREVARYGPHTGSYQLLVTDYFGFVQVESTVGLRTFIVVMASGLVPINVTYVLDADHMTWMGSFSLGFVRSFTQRGLTGQAYALDGGIGPNLYKISVAGDTFFDTTAGVGFGVGSSLVHTFTTTEIDPTWDIVNLRACVWDASDDSLVIQVDNFDHVPAHQRIIKYKEGVGILWNTSVTTRLPEGGTDVQKWGAINSRVSGKWAYDPQTTDGIAGNTQLTNVDTITGEVTYCTIVGGSGFVPADVTGYDYASNSLINWQPVAYGPGSWIREFACGVAPVGVTLGYIYRQQSFKVNFVDADIDASQCDVVNVWGYFQSRQMKVADSVMPLNMGYFVDTVETDWKLKFLLRPQAPSFALIEDELLLTKDDLGRTVLETPQQDFELPRRGWCTYIDREHDYQQGTKPYQRPVLNTISSQDITLAVPVALTGQEAKNIAARLVRTSWLERTSYDLGFAWKHIAIDPGDVGTITLNDGTVLSARATKADLGADYTTKFNGLSLHADAYVDMNIPASEDIPPPQTVIGGSGTTKAIIFDIPLLTDAGSVAAGSSRVYWSAGSANAQPWGGCILFKSDDNGVTYNAIDTDLSEMTWGVCAAALPDVYDPWAWDVVNTITVHLTSGDDEIASISDATVYAGGNAAAIVKTNGDVEIIQFANAVDNGDGSYTLSRLLRGRRLTETQTSGHTTGELFVLLNTSDTRPLALPTADANIPKYFKAMSTGSTLNQTTAIVRTLTAADQKPAFPVHFRAANVSGDLHLTWTRRTRIGGGVWVTGANVPLSETSEAYEVDILSGPSGTLKRTLTGLSSAAATYTAANITTDFGGMPTHLTVKIYQISATVGRGFTKEQTVEIV